jgi:homotetrameric NADPH-dependent glutamate synthase
MPGISKTGVPVPEIPAAERVRHFKEVPMGYTEEQAIEEAKRCLQCPDSPCSKNCPIHTDIRSFIKKLTEGKLEEAYLLIKKDDAIPAVTGRVCPQENQCEGACTLGRIGDPVNIGKLVSFLSGWARKNSVREEFATKEREQNIAIIGSGPSGISCAVDLRKMGYKVTIYEALHKAGGVLQYGIPEFRLPRDIIDKELDFLQEMGISIELNRIVGQNVSFERLRDEHDAIFIATGAGAPKFLGIEGEELNGFYSANEFLIRVNLMKAYRFPEYDTPIRAGKRVGVIGAGNVAMDAARSARRLGADVSILYRRTEKEAPARQEELRHAMEEGIEFQELVSPVRILGKDGWVTGIELARMRLGPPDKSGRPRPVKIEGSEFTMDLDTVIIALGTKPNRLFFENAPGLRIEGWGGIAVDGDLRTSIEGVYAGGDAISGGATVIQALGEGRKAAVSIHDYLSEGAKAQD